jgi:hypothetical protein
MIDMAIGFALGVVVGFIAAVTHAAWRELDHITT